LSLEELISKFIKYNDNLGHVFSHLRVLNLDPEKAEDVESTVDLARRYYEDASYFKDKNQVGTALISLAYCEGLLDALRLLKYVQFTWKT